MTDDTPFADDKNMAARASLAREFFAVTKPELVPFVSDEATWYDFDYLGSDELADVIEQHYGFVPDEQKLHLPFWQFLDYLTERRK